MLQSQTADQLTAPVRKIDMYRTQTAKSNLSEANQLSHPQDGVTESIETERAEDT